MVNDYTFTDAWILYSISDLKTYSGLKSILSYADYLNHAIPEYDEFILSTSRLKSAGIIKVNKKGYIITDRGRAIFKKLRSLNKKESLKNIDLLLNIMNCPCCGVNSRKLTLKKSISKEDYKNAIEEYHADF